MWSVLGWREIYELSNGADVLDESKIVEWIAAPLLKRAVDVLFDAGEALGRRVFGGKDKDVEEQAAHLEPLVSVEQCHMIGDMTQGAILSLTIDKAAVRARERELHALIEQIEVHHANLLHAQGQRAQWGEALVPAIILNTIKTEESNLLSKSERLGRVLSQLAVGNKT